MRVPLSTVAVLLASVLVVPASALRQVVVRTVGHGVRVDVLVTDGGRPVTGLQAEAFDVFDAGVLQQVDAAEVATHVAVALVLDTSLSVRVPGYDKVLAACEGLVGLLGPGDRAALLAFSDRVTVVVPLTADRGAVRRGLAAVPRFGAGFVPRSTVWDAVFAGAALVAEDPGRPLVLLISDGMDNASGLTRDGVARTLADLGISVDFVRTPWNKGSDDHFGPGPQTPETLPRRTDGVVHDVLDSKLIDRYRARLRTLGQAYVLTYIPRGVPTDNGWHELKVTVRKRGVDVKARPGYYANRGGR